MIAFADEDFVAVPGEGLALGAIAPAHERAAAAGRSDWEILEAKDLLNDRSWLCGAHGGERIFTRREVKLRLADEGVGDSVGSCVGVSGLPERGGHLGDDAFAQ
jgi:hypothetical protein